MFFLLIPVIVAYIIKNIFFRKKIESVTNKHIVITGGSSGIGKSFAILAAKNGANVTVIGRNVKKLNMSVAEIKQACINKDQNIQGISLDVTNYHKVEDIFNKIESSVGPIYMLVNCAGLAICGKLEDMSIDDMKTMVDINFLGTVYPTRVIVPKFKERRNGIIVIMASQAALLGIFGMAIYSGSKFALRGFAEALDMEVHPYNIGVTVALPPDTDTPGFENENKSKPLETKEICKAGGLFQPVDVAKKVFDDALKRKFFSTIGTEGFIMSTLCIGMSRSSILDVFFQVILLAPLRIAGAIFAKSFRSIIMKCNKDK